MVVVVVFGVFVVVVAVYAAAAWLIGARADRRGRLDVSATARRRARS